MNILDALTVISYIALNVDILLQIFRIYKTKSAEDISLLGLTVRYAAVLIILVKFISLGDLPLLFGQLLIVVTITLYLMLASFYRMRRR